jgi:signal transduction histidine kinase
MLSEFIQANHDEVVARSRSLVAHHTPVSAPPQPGRENDEIAVFVAQLAERLRRVDVPSDSEFGLSAKVQGTGMLRKGFSISQVVQSYGAVCQVVTEVAMERKAPISTEEFQTLNHCLDTVMAEAVKEYAAQRDAAISHQETERLGLLAHELRNLLGSAMMSFDILKTGSVSIGGNIGAVLGRSLRGLQDLIDGALAEVRLEAGLPKREHISIATFIQELEVAASFEAKASGAGLRISCDDDALVEIDRHILASAVGNLLQNAFKFTHKGGTVRLDVHSTPRRVLIDIADECGGLAEGATEKLFQPFEQGANNRTGLGLGLVISRRGVEANGGEIRVLNAPGTGCVFTIDLPRA